MKTMHPTVAVVIPTYNRELLLIQTLNSILGQTRLPDEVIVVDDGSPDNTPVAVAEYGSRVRYIRQKNAGKAVALNRAMNMVKSDYVWIMDDDDVALPDALERHLAFLNLHPERDFTYSGCYEFCGTAMPSASQYGKLDDCVKPPSSQFFLHCMQTFPFFMQGMLVPLRCYRQVGPFDAQLKRGQDYDMILRLARRFQGGKIVQPTFLFRIHSGVRGPAHERHSVTEKHAIWRHYDMKIFTKLHASLGLHEYLPRELSTRELTPVLTRQALLQRASIMARRGLFKEALTDITMATEKSLRDLPIVPAERQACATMLNVSPDLLAGHIGFSQILGRLVRMRIAPLLRDCARGLKWSLTRELGKGHYLRACKMLVHLARLIGLKGFTRLVWSEAGLLLHFRSVGHARGEGF